MPKYTVEVGGRKFEVEVKEEAPGTYRVKVGGKELVVRVTTSEEVREVREEVRPAPVSAAPAEVPSPTPPPAAPAVSGEGLPVTAEVPGKVLRVLVSEGAEVKAGQTLLTLESMKMELEVRAPRDGVVKKVLVKEGDSVRMGQPLVLLG